MNQSGSAWQSETKAALRGRFLAERKQLAEADVVRRSQVIAEHFLDYLSRERLIDSPASVHTFLAIQRQKEVNTWPIINAIWDRFHHLSIVVPVTNFKTGLMHHYPLFPDTPLIENALGIPEPLHSHRTEASLADVRLVIVPLLAFDRQGHRVGYGKGFYDRFLIRCPPDCLKIGLSLFEPVSEISDVETTDVRLDGCVTPTGIWQFNK